MGCSPDKPQPPNTTASKSDVFGRFVVTFAVVKILNNILGQHGCPSHGTNGYYFDSIEASTKFAAYILAHTNEFSFTTTTGNCVPIVHTHQQTSVKFILDPKQEEEDFEKYGVHYHFFGENEMISIFKEKFDLVSQETKLSEKREGVVLLETLFKKNRR